MDAQADLSLSWTHTHFVGFVMSWLIYISSTLSCSNLHDQTKILFSSLDAKLFFFNHTNFAFSRHFFFILAGGGGARGEKGGGRKGGGRREKGGGRREKRREGEGRKGRGRREKGGGRRAPLPPPPPPEQNKLRHM